MTLRTIPVNVAHVWFWSIAMVAIYAIMWGILEPIAQAIILTFSTEYPQFFNEQVVSLYQNMWKWSPVFVLLIGFLLSIYVEMQRRPVERYYYG